MNIYRKRIAYPFFAVSIVMFLVASMSVTYWANNAKPNTQRHETPTVKLTTMQNAALKHERKRQQRKAANLELLKKSTQW